MCNEISNESLKSYCELKDSNDIESKHIRIMADELLQRRTIEQQYQQLAIELREILFDDANDITQGGMSGSPLDCIAFAKWWIQRKKGIEVDL